MKIRLCNNKYSIGRNFRQYRLENKLTQEETVAKLRYQGIRMPRATYSYIESGRGNVRVKELYALADVFAVEVSDFFKGISLN